MITLQGTQHLKQAGMRRNSNLVFGDAEAGLRFPFSEPCDYIHLLPLDTVLRFLLDESYPLQNISNVVDSALLADSKRICRLKNEGKQFKGESKC